LAPKVGEEITVRISRIEARRRRISLGLRPEDRPGRRMEHDASVGDRVEGVVRNIKPYGIFLDLPSLGPWVSGLLPAAETGLGREVNLRKKFREGEKLEVEIVEIDEQGRLRLSRRSFLEAESEGTPEGVPTARGGSGKGLSTAPPGGFNVLAEALRRAQNEDDSDAETSE
jgi:ribosomal protein S1